MDQLERFSLILKQAQELVSKHFEKIEFDPDRGTLRVGSERYLLVRASSLAVDFYEFVHSLYAAGEGDKAFRVARSTLYDVAHTLGRTDGRAQSKRMDVSDPETRVALGPSFFAHSGWAAVEFLPESSLIDGTHFVLAYQHPRSFEADAWIEAGKVPHAPACVMSAGYSAGWCSDAMERPMAAVEISCRALGHDACRFVMAPEDRLEEEARRISANYPAVNPDITSIPTTGYLKAQLSGERLREREAQYRAVFEGVSNGLLVMDPNGYVVQINPEASRLLGVSASRDEPVYLDALLEQGEVTREIVTAVQEHGSYRGRLTLGRRAQVIVHMEVRATPIAHYGHDRLLIVLHETTEAERTRQSLQAVNDMLEAKTRDLYDANVMLKQVNQDLIQARDEALEASRSKSDFLARMTHEFRTPLNAVIGYAELIQEEHEGGLPEGVAHDLLRIKSSAEHLLNLINELLDIAKIEAAEMTVSAISIPIMSFFESVMDTTRPLAERAGIELSLHIAEIPGPVMSDAVKIRQIALNLISNAIKFTDQGQVEVRVWLEPQDPGWILNFTVSDTGIGIAPERQGQLFDPFWQEDESTTRRHGGTGLGLSISRAFARLLGGEIELESELNVGSTFHVRIPVWISLAPSGESAPSP